MRSYEPESVNALPITIVISVMVLVATAAFIAVDLLS